MKKHVLNSELYTFDSSAGTLTFDRNCTFKLENFIMVSNTTSGTIMFNFACEGMTGTFEGCVLDLELNTSSMSNDDSLVVIIQEEDTTTDAIEQIKDNTRATRDAMMVLVEHSILNNNLLKLILS